LVPSGFGVALTSRVDDMETKENVKVGDEFFHPFKHTFKVGNGVQLRGLVSNTWNCGNTSVCRWWPKCEVRNVGATSPKDSEPLDTTTKLLTVRTPLQSCECKIIIINMHNCTIIQIQCSNI
jgi:hypothetical protein